ncbi:hypothetical protein OIU81_35815 [Streptomyces sp. NBC_01454]|uniref:hypothetical protein n=1 Tax=Streptomyces sp. NBC_01454 TaxID=2975867 RepID=UPI002E316FA2|nr:hypothetical protein [Streptomyces sp. NBC_01454]
MPTVRTLRSLLGVGVLAVGLAVAPAPAHAQTSTSVLCSESALVNAITTANAIGGDTLALFPFCTYRITSAHHLSARGPVGLPAITTPLKLIGIGNIIERDPGAAQFRVLQVEGSANVPGTNGQLTAQGITVRGGSAVSPYPGGGISNLGGTVSLSFSDVSGNTAVAGGGLYNDNGVMVLSNTHVHHNSAPTTGGGIYLNSGSVLLTDYLTNVRDNTPDNCAPPGSVGGCV